MPNNAGTCGFIPPTPGYAPCRRLVGHEGPCAHELIAVAQRLERYGDWQIVARWNVHPMANCTAFATPPHADREIVRTACNANDRLLRDPGRHARWRNFRYETPD